MAFFGVLLSSGFSNPAVLSFVQDLVRSRSYTKAVIVTTAHPKKEKSRWGPVTKEQLVGMGLSVSFVDFDAGESLGDDSDVVYVCGGNTFHLLKSIQTSPSPIRHQLIDLFDRGGCYIGSSAGSVIVSPTIASAEEVGGDVNRDTVTEYAGLNLIPWHVLPHDSPSHDEAVAAFCHRHSLDETAVIRLRDGEAAIVENGSWTYLADVIS